MHHIVQDNLFGEFGFVTLINALEAQSVPYTIVKVVPFLHELEPAVDIDGPVMVWGATTLGHIAKTKGWTPGQFKNDNFDMRVLHEKYGNHMLNDDAKFCTFAELDFEGEMFVRPVHDSKTFSGEVIASENMAAWKAKVLPISNDGFSTLASDTVVMYAAPKDIELEARFFVVAGKVITGSSYRSLGRQIMYQCVENNNPLLRPALDFAQEMTDLWSPADAFVLDIGQVNGRYKVVEINCINNAGFYASNMGTVIKAIENM